MNSSRYNQLQEASNHYNQAYRQYENAAAQFTRQLREELANYLGCPVEKVIWPRFKENMPDPERIMRYAMARSFWLDQDGFWHFRLRIDFGGSWLELPLAIKPLEKYCIVIHAEEDPRNVTSDDMGELVKYIFESAKLHLETTFENFLKGKDSPKSLLGFTAPLTVGQNAE